MKRTAPFVLAAVLALSLIVTAFAADITKVGTMTITLVVPVSYEVVIPANTTIPFESTSASLGNLGLASATLEPKYQVSVTASHDALKNSANESQTIAYTLKNGTDELKSTAFTAAGTIPLTVEIAQSAWDTAAGGSYSDTITFSFVYEQV